MLVTLGTQDIQRLGAEPPQTVRDMILAATNNDQIGLIFEDQEFTHAQVVAEAVKRANLLLSLPRTGPLHVGLLLDNVPDFSFWMAAGALSGAAVVPFNPTRRGNELASDIAHLECTVLITESRHKKLISGLENQVGVDRVFDIDEPLYSEQLGSFAGQPIPDVEVKTTQPFLYVFTSGSTGAPKACRVSHGRFVLNGKIIAAIHSLDEKDVLYEAMPFFHSSILMSCWSSGWAVGATHVMRRRFSASSFLKDVRRNGATYFGYVGKPLAYILATHEEADDATNPLRSGQGNEGSPLDLRRFSERFGCLLRDGYGSTEGCVTIARTPDTPFAALGRPRSETMCIVNPETLEECPAARFDEQGTLLNADRAIGEIVEKLGSQTFEGYYNNPEAEAARLRLGWYWSGDLAYRDEAGWVYFAGRNGDMIRVDGENLSTAMIERIMERDPNIIAVAAYPVEARIGDDLMLCVELRRGRGFDPIAFSKFLNEQDDLGLKMRPRYVRVVSEMPLTGSHKVDRRALRRTGLLTADQIWSRRSDGSYEEIDRQARSRG